MWACTYMRVSGDYHLHTRFSDGRTSVFKHAKKAKEMGFLEIAITDHSFGSFVFHMTRRKWQRLKGQIAKIKDVKVYQGIEGNIINGAGTIDVPDDIIRECDILLCGFHRFLEIDKIKSAPNFVLTNGYGPNKWGSYESAEDLREVNTDALKLAMRRYPIDVIAHPNHRMLVDVKRLCEVARDMGVYIELNAKHLDVLEESGKDIADSGVKLIIGTDAHDTRKTGKMDKVIDFINRHNIPLDRVYGINGNMPIFKDKKSFGLN